MKIGIIDLHWDEFLMIKDLFSGSEDIRIIPIRENEINEAEIISCDILVLFDKHHWKFLKYNKPYFIVVVHRYFFRDISNVLGKHNYGILGKLFSHKLNPNFKGLLCGSIELYNFAKNLNIPAFFYHKKYPFGPINNEPIVPNSPKEIITLINKYKDFSRKYIVLDFQTAYNNFEYIRKNTKNLQLIEYGYPSNPVSTDDANVIQQNARYTIHIKYWGHVCNAVVKSLALGTPVIMDEKTFKIGKYEAYLKHGHNSLVFKNKKEIVGFLNSTEEQTTWQHLKTNCLNEANYFHLPYSEQEKINIEKYI